MAKKQTFKTHTTAIDSAVSDAFSGMDELKDELQNWYDNLPESFQNGSKGEALQEAIGNIEGASEVDIPDCLTNGPELPEVTYSESTRTSRSARRDTCVSMLNGAADAGREYVETLNALEYEDGKLKPSGIKTTSMLEDEGWPEDEDTRDAWVSEIETFVDDCENAASEYENVEFPGMYG